MLPGSAFLVPTHERWFTPAGGGGDWGFFFHPLPILLCIAMVAVAVLWRLVAMRVTGPELSVLEPLSRLVPWVPRLLGVHLGVSLIALAATGAFLTPAVDDLHRFEGSMLLLGEAVLGVWFVVGWRLRAAAATLLTLGPILAVLAGPMALLECANVAAVAAFLLFLPPESDSFGAASMDRARLRWALLAMRVGVGSSLIALAFTEKFTNPGMAARTLAEYPALNVFSLLGSGMDTETFIAIAGAVEFLFGLLILSGAWPQVVVLVAAVPFNATLVLFGQTELVGHLPVYGVFLALLVYGSSRDTASFVRWLPHLERARRTYAVRSTSATVS